MLRDEAFPIATAEEEISLARLSVSDLGFKHGASYQEIYNQATQIGLEYCPPEVGPQLRIQYSDQPKGEVIMVAMEPLWPINDFKRIFRVGNGNLSCHLGSEKCQDITIWAPDTLFAFKHGQQPLAT